MVELERDGDGPRQEVISGGEPVNYPALLLVAIAQVRQEMIMGRDGGLAAAHALLAMLPPSLVGEFDADFDELSEVLASRRYGHQMAYPGKDFSRTVEVPEWVIDQVRHAGRLSRELRGEWQVWHRPSMPDEDLARVVADPYKSVLYWRYDGAKYTERWRAAQRSTVARLLRRILKVLDAEGLLGEGKRTELTGGER